MFAQTATHRRCGRGQRGNAWNGAGWRRGGVRFVVKAVYTRARLICGGEGVWLRGQEQTSRAHKLVHYEKDHERDGHQDHSGDNLGACIQARFVRIERPGAGVRSRSPALGGQSARQRWKCQRLCEGQLVNGLAERVGTHRAARRRPEQHVLQIEGIEQRIAGGHCRWAASSIVLLAVSRVPIGLWLQPGIGDALLCARRADSIGRGRAGAAAGGGNAATASAAPNAANMTRGCHTPAQADRCHGCQRRRRRRRGRAQTQVGRESIVVKFGGILNWCLIRRCLRSLQCCSMFHAQREEPRMIRMKQRTWLAAIVCCGTAGHHTDAVPHVPAAQRQIRWALRGRARRRNMTRPAARLSTGQTVHTRRCNERIGRRRCLHRVYAGVTCMQRITVQWAASLCTQGQVIAALSGGRDAVVVAAAAATAGRWSIVAADACLYNGRKDEGLAIRFAAWWVL